MGGEADKNDLMSELGRRIRRRRKEKDWSQRRLADEASISARFLIQVEGGKAVFRPGVYREMAFLNDNDTRDAIGREVVEGGIDYREPSICSRLHHAALDMRDVVQQCRRTTEKLNKDVATKGIHLPLPQKIFQEFSCLDSCLKGICPRNGFHFYDQIAGISCSV